MFAGANIGGMRWTAWWVLCAVAAIGCAEREDAIAVSAPASSFEAGPPCTVFAQGTDFGPCAATYLGGPGPDQANAVAVGADGSIVVGGSIAGNDFGLAALRLTDADAEPGATLEGSGVIVRLDPSVRVVESMTRFETAIVDLDVGSGGDIAIGGAFGIARLDASAGSLRWMQKWDAPADRVSLGDDGVLGALSGKTVRLFDERGASLGTVVLTDDVVEDIVVDGASQSFVVTGSNPGGGAGCATRLAFVRSYSYAGQIKWDDYAFQATDIAPHCSSTAGRRVAMGGDGKLYFGGESTGGDTIFAWDPTDITTRAPLVAGDSYSNPYNAGRAQIVFVARLAAATGALESGTQMVARAVEGEAGPSLAASLTLRALAADREGNVLLGGTSECCIEHRDQLSIAGQPVGPFPAAGAEGYALLLSNDFATRRLWTTFTRSHGAPTAAVALSNATGALVANVPAGSTLVTSHALQPDPAGGAEAFVASWKTR